MTVEIICSIHTSLTNGCFTQGTFKESKKHQVLKIGTAFLTSRKCFSNESKPNIPRDLGGGGKASKCHIIRCLIARCSLGSTLKI